MSFSLNSKMGRRHQSHREKQPNLPNTNAARAFDSTYRFPRNLARLEEHKKRVPIDPAFATFRLVSVKIQVFVIWVIFHCAMSSVGGVTNARDRFSEFLHIARGIQKGLQDLGTLIEQSDNSPSTAHSDTEVAPVGAGFASVPVAVAETEVKEPTPPSTATGSVAADFLWPDGCMVFEVPWGQVRHGVAHFGWMFACNNTKKLRGGARRRYYYCLGVFTCPSCNFVARPQRPLKVKIGAAAKLPTHVCPRHPDTPLLWIPCNGGRDTCKLVLDIAPTGTIEAAHSGVHDHPHPPTSKP
jgi:hypothetical protein